MSPCADTPVSVSVVVICFNQARYITETLESVLAQTAQNRICEIFVVDDCSSDNSVAVADEISRRDPRITVLRREKNSGGCASPRNDGMVRASGTHIALLDGDDIWLPEKIERQVEVLEAYPEIGLLYSDYLAFSNESGEEIREVVHSYRVNDQEQLKRFFVHGGPIIPSCAVVSQRAVKAVGLFDPEMRFNEDSEYWMRVASACPIHHQPIALIRKREWFGSLGSAKYGLENLECKREITRRMVERVPELAAVAALREAQIEYKTAVHYFALKETRAARRHLRKALALDAGLRKARLFLALSYLSSDPKILLHFVRRTRTRMLTALR